MIWLRRMHAFISRWVWLVELVRLFGLISFLPFVRRRRCAAGELGPLVVIRMDGLGDSVLFARWLGGLRLANPGRRLIVMVRPSVVPLLRRMDLVDEVIPVDTWALLFGITARSRLFRLLRDMQASEVLVPMIGGDVFWADALVMGLGTVRSVGVAEASQGSLLRWARRRIYTELVSVSEDVGIWGKNRRIVSRFCPDAVPLTMETIHGKLTRNAGRGQHFVLFPGANFEYRRWPVDRFMALGAKIQALTGWTPVVCGGAQEADLVSGALHLIPGADNQSGKQSLEGLTETLATARMVISNDTGPAHLASALGTPLVVFVGGGQPGLFFPYPAEELYPGGPQLVVEKGRACAGCDWHCPYSVDPCKPRPCVDEISLEEIWDSVACFVGKLEF